MRDLSTLKLCFLAGTLEHGGAERQLFYMLRALCQAGATPRLLSLDQGEFWEEKIQSLGVRVTWVGGHSSRLKRLVRVLKEMRQDPPAVLQSQHFYANAYVGLTARLLPIAGIGALRSNGRIEVQESGRLGGWLNLHCTGTLAGNSKMALQYAMVRGVPAARLYFLPNVVDTDWFQPANHFSNGPVTLLAMGRLVREKRLDRFLAIMERLKNSYHLNVRGLIVGPGCQDEDLRPELERLAQHFGLLNNIVQFRGGLADVRSVYREATICVLTSDYEGTPNVLLEAMACGLPVVASKVGGVPDIVRHGETGLLVEPEDLAGFAAAVAGLVQNPERRNEMGRCARSFVEEYHSLQRLPAYLAGLYQQALPRADRSTASVCQGAAS